eukprot:CAMPEP_0202965778 /NCGR_PEP_ID=MMETSP1396-20130829/9824_1 /ASSEMBLY_ACC=CAM_ASM_000872 /TAXON_ID= /ORGANISM="Pseudokeronopsis sp., Strain Brazil" /LENGTH=67 /DNA_ID=CAMNT_0049688803 /DNA_START=279 /DNA_END=479 /DNA_ORIENTATION=-
MKEADEFLQDIQAQLDNGELQPNYNPEHHIVHFVCGAGKHSGDPQRLIKKHLFEHLKKQFGGEERLF